MRASLFAHAQAFPSKSNFRLLIDFLALIKFLLMDRLDSNPPPAWNSNKIAEINNYFIKNDFLGWLWFGGVAERGWERRLRRFAMALKRNQFQSRNYEQITTPPWVVGFNWEAKDGRSQKERASGNSTDDEAPGTISENLMKAQELFLKDTECVLRRIALCSTIVQFIKFYWAKKDSL